MDKKNKSLVDDGNGDIILNESGTSVSLEDIDEAPANEEPASVEDKVQKLTTGDTKAKTTT